jgi:hypothetical protein
LKITIICIIVLGFILPGSAASATSQGGNWIEINSSAAFSPRCFQTATAFNNQIWLIGGATDKYQVNEIALNDIWTSHDGNDWTLVTGHADFSPRYGHGAVVFHGKLWVIGGRQNYTSTNDVWSSNNGVNWTLVTMHAGFSPRFLHSVAVFNDRLWVIGGMGDANDVWSSDDGVNWTPVTNHPGFTPRHGQGIAVYDNQLWIIGGQYSYIEAHGWRVSGISKEVWSSRNGATWTEVNRNALFEYLEFRPVAVYDNKMWLVGGGRDVTEFITGKPQNPIQYAYNSVWSSPDGINWTLESDDAGFSPRYGHSVTEFDNKIWVIGGFNPSLYQENNDVWSYQSRNLALISVNETAALQSLTPGNETQLPVSGNTTNRSPVPARTGPDPVTSIIFILAIFGILGYYRRRS